MRWIPPVVLLAASALASALPTTAPPASDDLSGLIGQPAPGGQLEHWFNSEPLALEDLRGKVVVVRWFMAPSCPLCSATAPALNRFDEEYRGRGLVVIACTTTRTPSRSMSRPCAATSSTTSCASRGRGPRLADPEALVARRPTSARGRASASSSIGAA